MRVVRTGGMSPALLSAFAELIGERRTAAMAGHCDAIREILDGGTLWHVNSTDAGGGVAEMLHTLVPMYRRCGVDVRWAVIEGDARFFDITKRLGNLAYGSDDPADQLTAADRRHYVAHARTESTGLLDLLGPRDVVLLHDHQTAGLAGWLARPGRAVHWRCHIGVDIPTAGSHHAWEFLAPQLDGVAGVAFSVARHLPDELRGVPHTVITPIIWPFSAKNRALSDEELHDGLRRAGLAEWASDQTEPLVTQVSRWDRLKDMHGVLDAFAEYVPSGRLALVGPDPAGIPDDIDQARWYATCVRAHRALPRDRRERIALVCLPMTDLDDNALLVNAIQRSATTVLQKSLAEGFGLTVTEAMWKGRPVIGSAVGGISEQITHGRNGLLVTDPHDPAELGDLIKQVVGDQSVAHTLGEQAHRSVHGAFLPDNDVAATAALLAKQDQMLTEEETG